MTQRNRKKHAPQGESSTRFSLGGLLDGIQKLVETAAALQKTGPVRETGEFTIPGLGDKGKGIFGFSIRTLAGGEDGGQSGGVRVQPFGNIHKTKQGGLSVEEAREPVVDVFEEGDAIRVIAELPGVCREAVHYEINGDVLTITTEGDRHYNAEVLLPAPAKLEGAQSSFNNGIFELKLAKA